MFWLGNDGSEVADERTSNVDPQEGRSRCAVTPMPRRRRGSTSRRCCRQTTKGVLELKLAGVGAEAHGPPAAHQHVAGREEDAPPGKPWKQTRPGVGARHGLRNALLDGVEVTLVRKSGKVGRAVHDRAARGLRAAAQGRRRSGSGRAVRADRAQRRRPDLHPLQGPARRRRRSRARRACRTSRRRRTARRSSPTAACIAPATPRTSSRSSATPRTARRLSAAGRRQGHRSAREGRAEARAQDQRRRRDRVRSRVRRSSPTPVTGASTLSVADKPLAATTCRSRSSCPSA